MRPLCGNFGKWTCWRALQHLALVLLICGLSFSGARPALCAEPVMRPEAKALQAQQKQAPTDLYATDPEPLSATQCGQCHTGVFRQIKAEGRRHKFACQNCHRDFHAYNPEKKNWQELMPKCNGCHGAQHGEAFQTCSNCHSNPHAIGQMQASKSLQGSCGTCHQEPADQLKKYPSAHTKLSCSMCHKSHGQIPSCENCHRPHFTGQDFETCSEVCHPVHMPRQGAFDMSIDPKTCGVCHAKVSAKLAKTKSRHASVTCAQCHSKHRSAPDCRQCHSLPHSKQVHDKYPRCLTCHQDVHDLPVR